MNFDLKNELDYMVYSQSKKKEEALIELLEKYYLKFIESKNKIILMDEIIHEKTNALGGIL